MKLVGIGTEMAEKKRGTKKKSTSKSGNPVFPKPKTQTQQEASDKKVEKAEKTAATWISSSRIQSLTDGIFAFAMTLLVLNLILPDPANLPPETQLNDILLKQVQAFYNYVLSFILLAIFWTINTQQFHVIKGTNQTHTWINLTIMLFVVLIPFSTSVMADYPTDTTANVLFSMNMFIVGALYSLNWNYAVSDKHKLIDSSANAEAIEISKRRGLIVPIISIVALVVAFIAPGFTGLCFLFIPILKALKPFRA